MKCVVCEGKIDLGGAVHRRAWVWVAPSIENGGDGVTVIHDDGCADAFPVDAYEREVLREHGPGILRAIRRYVNSPDPVAHEPGLSRNRKRKVA